MEFDNNIPVYVQILSYLKEIIIKKELKEGDKMPSVRELAKDLKVNPNTVQRAYRELESEGLIISKRGMGSYVTDNEDMINNLRNDIAKETVISFSNRMKNMGFCKKQILEIIDYYVEGD
ncbi:GntR family transcriptional regulator [Vallitalea guaymasensis]|uniref:GntR family transcriptional regulator n=1 Tax=Vallitalea guaymasensis TaxID=1185412 RepID=A0A8J8MDB2_9FIRM|nr:GntR family transcriptional regulator [Vallitalea guaymasensis]QUH30739.1 GntR family transcriptional regulator [Vallitalea guaymasensis]